MRGTRGGAREIEERGGGPSVRPLRDAYRTEPWRARGLCAKVTFLAVHSCRRASMGSSRAALIAGNIPKISPTAAANPNDNATAQPGIDALVSCAAGMLARILVIPS